MEQLGYTLCRDENISLLIFPHGYEYLTKLNWTHLSILCWTINSFSVEATVLKVHLLSIHAPAFILPQQRSQVPFSLLAACKYGHKL